MPVPDSPILLLTSQFSIYGARVLNALVSHGINVVGVILERKSVTKTWARTRRRIRNVGILPVMARGVEVLASRASGWVRHEQGQEPIEDAIARLGLRRKVVNTVNGTESQEFLRAMRPALGVLAGVGILKRRVIQPFPLGILNVHPGLLPRYRGNYCNRWALLHGEDCGLSVYVVDNGIDTGPILRRQIVNRLPGEGINEMDVRVTEYGVELLADTAGRYLTGQLVPKAQRLDDGREYGLLPVRELLTLHWRTWCDPPPDIVLPERNKNE